MTAFGVRNHVIILPVDDISNAAANGVASLIKGTMALPHPYGRLQFGEDFELTFGPWPARAAIRTSPPRWSSASNRTGPTASSRKLPKRANRWPDSALNGPVTSRPSKAASRKAKEFVQYATELPREPFPVRKLVMSAKCGESDTTTAWPPAPPSGAPSSGC